MNPKVGWTELGTINPEILEKLASDISRDKPQMVRISREERTREAKIEISADMIQLDPHEYQAVDSPHKITRPNVYASLSVAAKGIARNIFRQVVLVRRSVDSTCFYVPYLG